MDSTFVSPQYGMSFQELQPAAPNQQFVPVTMNNSGNPNIIWLRLAPVQGTLFFDPKPQQPKLHIEYTAESTPAITHKEEEPQLMKSLAPTRFRPFVCGRCDLAFESIKDLGNHRPYECSGINHNLGPHPSPYTPKLTTKIEEIKEEDEADESLVLSEEFINSFLSSFEENSPPPSSTTSTSDDSGVSSRSPSDTSSGSNSPDILKSLVDTIFTLEGPYSASTPVNVLPSEASIHISPSPGTFNISPRSETIINCQTISNNNKIAPTTTTTASNTTTNNYQLKIEKPPKQRIIPPKQQLRIVPKSGPAIPSPLEISEMIYGPLACPSCPKVFSTRSKFMDHQVVHSEDRQFICPQCKSSYKRNKDLRRHERRRHPPM